MPTEDRPAAKEVSGACHRLLTPDRLTVATREDVPPSRGARS